MSGRTKLEPDVSTWYWSYGELFEVVAVDEASGDVEIRFADGTLTDLEHDEWTLRSQSGALQQADPPAPYSSSRVHDAREKARRESRRSHSERSAETRQTEPLKS